MLANTSRILSSILRKTTLVSPSVSRRNPPLTVVLLLFSIRFFFRSPIRFTLVVPSPFLFPSPSIGQAVHPSPLSLFFFSPGCSLSLSPASENEKTLAFFTCSSTTKTPLPPRSVSSWQRDGAGGRDTKSRCFAKERKRDARDEIITRKGSHGRFVLIPMRGNARYAADNIPRNAFNAGGTRMRWHTV